MILRNIVRGLFSRRPSHSVTNRLEDEGRQQPLPFIRHPDVPSVLVLTHSYAGNGAAEMLIFLLRWMSAELGWQVRAYSQGLREADKKALADVGVELVGAIHPEQYDFAITNTLVSGPEFIQHLAGHLGCLLWVHEAESMLWNNLSSVGSWKEVFSVASHLVFQSSWQAERIFGSFTSGLPAGRYSVIPNCLPVIPEAGELAFPRRPGIKRIVFVGSVFERKRPMDLVDAVLALGREDVECILVGGTEHLETLSPRHRKILAEDRRFILTGELPRAQATAYLASADVLSLPSADESQPLVLLEAAHFNVPIVISDLQVYSGIWTDGVNCLKHPARDPVTLSKQLGAALAGLAPPPVMPKELDFSAASFFSKLETVLQGLLPERLRGYSQASRGALSTSSRSPVHS